MGCSTSKLDDEEAVQLCKDRKKFIRQAVEHRAKFASGHIAYIQAMKRVSSALREYIDGDEPREFLLDSFTTPAFTPIKKTSPGFISISPDSFSVTPFKSETNSSYKINYFKSGGNSSVSVEERLPQSPETYRVQAYSPIRHFGMDSMFAMQSSPMNASFFQYSPNNRPNYPPPSPQTSQWDFFWNPFSSLDYYGYPTRSSVDQGMLDDENAELQQVREEEGIPELEEETEHEDIDDRMTNKEESGKFNVNIEREEVVVEDVDDSDDSDSDCETDGGHELEKHVQELPSQEKESIEVAKAQNVGQISKKETAVADCESKEETPGFTVYVNRRPTSMAEVIKDLEDQFVAACNAAGEMSSILEASRARYSSSSNDLSAMKMLNPVALFRSASSRSSSARFLVTASTSREESYESSSDLSEESCIWSHQSTLDRLYAWEKKLYQEVRAGERVRIQYEKKCAQLRNQDVKGDDPSFVDKTRAAMRDLDTQIKVSIHSVEAISKRIETLRDEELEPQLLELVHGLSRMWKVMAECHQMQKRTLDEAKILLAGTPSKLSGTKKYTIMSPSEPHRLARSASNLETELRNWRACFDTWIVSQRSYIHALSGWLLRCVRPDPSTKLPYSPRRSLGAPPIFNICIQWSRFLDAIQEAPVLDGMDFFVAGVGSLYAQQLREDSRRQSGGSKRFGPEIAGNMEVVEAGRFEDEVMTAEKMAEVAIRVLCAGMSVAVSALTEFAVSSADGYADLIKQLENGKQSLHGTEK
ncbi:uncharacterized protein LOC105161647 [Sesamum indicum]|uniref:Uncharacterized protein LOC105161647 n=1 Tax=Sesamum indicum TaxID=4182 RepID=A0A6I9T402_SESIN|nr:uncharacterized protein LOC105161647 [Sesamum indicum]XP_011077704.1 uncharacterized protein LOC105161647 [Sesamum indicum]XP_020549729.1 uncharacterized protein LOC105161647 [Sesamum indicum]XP_020549730.1 uncharacterized protein LOC105161647 [Sesamum indicum]